MAKAQLVTKDGTKVTLEGSHEEIAALIARLDGAASAGKARRPAPTKAKGTSKPTLTGLLGDLIDSGFFKKPKGLGAIKAALEEAGHFYPVTTLSPIVLSLVRRKMLRRIKDKNKWTYVG